MAQGKLKKQTNKKCKNLHQTNLENWSYFDF